MPKASSRRRLQKSDPFLKASDERPLRILVAGDHGGAEPYREDEGRGDRQSQAGDPGKN